MAFKLKYHCRFLKLITLTENILVGAWVCHECIMSRDMYAYSWPSKKTIADLLIAEDLITGVRV